MYFPLLLWSDAYWFGKIAQFFLLATLVVGVLALLLHLFTKPKPEPKVALDQPPAARKPRGGTMVMLLIAALLFALFWLAKWAATPYYLR